MESICNRSNSGVWCIACASSARDRRCIASCEWKLFSHVPVEPKGQREQSPTAEALNLPKGLATVLMAASDLTMILSEMKATRTELDALREEVARERAIDRRRIAALEREEPQPLQKDRGEILRALLVANGGKMLAKDARKRMHLSESRFSELLAGGQ